MKELNIAATLTRLRKSRGVTQEQLATYLGVSKASVSKWECGQSYPDISFLPALASYFNTTVDELIDYQPQLPREDIRRLYHRLTGDFAEKPFDTVMTETREIVKKYYSCFPLLFHIGLLYYNHHMLTDPARQPDVLNEAMTLFDRIMEQSDDPALVKQAMLLRATCCLSLNRPQEVVSLLEPGSRLLTDDSILLSSAYARCGQPDRAKEILQISLYQQVLNCIQALLQLLQLHLDNRTTGGEILRRTQALADTFQVDTLHPATALLLWLTVAGVYATWNDRESTLDALDRYAAIATGGIFPIHLSGDSFFDRIDDWMQDFDLGTDVPRDERVIRQSLLSGVRDSPVFAPYADDPHYIYIINKLTVLTGGY